jgi:hypothetical protein
MSIDYDRLKEPFAESDLEWRIQSSGIKPDGEVWARVVAYITNRAVMDRLDEVFGVNGWQNEFKPGPGGGVICGISFYDPDRGEWITKWDGADNTQIEAIKGGLSGAMKRAVVHLGIGRYLYGLEDDFAITYHPDHKHVKNFDWAYANREDARARKNGKAYRWAPPKLPAWALPKGHKPTTPPKVTAVQNQAIDIEARREALHQKSIDLFRDGVMSQADGVRFMERVKILTTGPAFDAMWKILEVYEAVRHYEQDGRFDLDTANAWRDAILNASTVEVVTEIGERINAAVAA